jgi:hypothetical protein
MGFPTERYVKLNVPQNNTNKTMTWKSDKKRKLDRHGFGSHGFRGVIRASPLITFLYK